MTCVCVVVLMLPSVRILAAKGLEEGSVLVVLVWHVVSKVVPQGSNSHYLPSHGLPHESSAPSESAVMIWAELPDLKDSRSELHRHVT
jgi:hypothetical protein